MALFIAMISAKEQHNVASHDETYLTICRIRPVTRCSEEAIYVAITYGALIFKRFTLMLYFCAYNMNNRENATFSARIIPRIFFSLQH